MFFILDNKCEGRGCEILHYFSNNNEVKRLQILLAKVSTGDESIHEKDEEAVDREQYSKYVSNSKEDLNLCNELDIF